MSPSGFLQLLWSSSTAGGYPAVSAGTAPSPPLPRPPVPTCRERGAGSAPHRQPVEARGAAGGHSPASAVGLAVAAEALCGETRPGHACGRAGQPPPSPAAPRGCGGRSRPVPSRSPQGGTAPSPPTPRDRPLSPTTKAGRPPSTHPRRPPAAASPAARRPAPPPAADPRAASSARRARSSRRQPARTARLRGETCPGSPLPGKQPPGCASPHHPPASQPPPGPNAAAARPRAAPGPGGEPREGKGRPPPGRAGGSGESAEGPPPRSPGSGRGDGCSVPQGPFGSGGGGGDTHGETVPKRSSAPPGLSPTAAGNCRARRGDSRHGSRLEPLTVAGKAFVFTDLKLPSALENYHEGLNSTALILPLGSLSSMERDRVGGAHASAEAARLHIKHLHSRLC